ncbi:hypothetical protein CCH79_00019736 [Gambusia affinis]|uniref:Ig-like domain-containing protein n=1 Tax=Gambusia affinis TaxID=33528 RepID=A0A315V791_GAMAF|nr:hypothetical protein CCH79_00019736 [Gambusia affinis]
MSPCALWRRHLHPDDMKSSSGRLLLVFLSVSPNLQQFFTGDSSVSLNCLHDGRTAEGWTVRGTGPAGDCGPPGSGSGPSCVLSLSGPSAGRFWCEASSGQRSDNVSITVLGEDMSTCPPVHLSSVGQSEPGGTRLVPPGSEGPVEPLTSAPVQVKDSSWRSRLFLSEQDVMSRCAAGAVTVTSLRRSSSWVSAGWDPDRSWFSSRLTSYWCSTNQFGRSPLSFLRVTDPPLPHTPPPLVSGPTRPTGSPPPSSSPPLPQTCVSVPRLLCHLLVICPYCACSVLLLLRCCSRKSGEAPPTGSPPSVAMETTQPAEPDRVTTEHDF